MNTSLVALEKALRSGNSLQPVLDSVGVAEMMWLMEITPTNLMDAYFREKAAKFTERREIVTCYKLLGVAFAHKKQASRFYQASIVERIKDIADTEFEKQKLLFRQQNLLQFNVCNDIWQLFYLTGPKQYLRALPESELPQLHQLGKLAVVGIVQNGIKSFKYPEGQET